MIKARREHDLYIAWRQAGWIMTGSHARTVKNFPEDFRRDVMKEAPEPEEEMPAEDILSGVFDFANKNMRQA